MLDTVIWWTGAAVLGGEAFVIVAFLWGLAGGLASEGTYEWLKASRNWWTIIRWLRAKRDRDPLEKLARELTEANGRAEDSRNRFERAYEETKRQLGEHFDLDAWHRAVYPEQYEEASR